MRRCRLWSSSIGWAQPLHFSCSIVMNVNRGNSSWKDYVFKHVQDAGNLNFVFLCRGRMILMQDRLYSERVTCAGSFGVMSRSVVVSVWHQTSSWDDFKLLPRCVIISLEEGWMQNCPTSTAFLLICFHMCSPDEQLL